MSYPLLALLTLAIGGAAFLLALRTGRYGAAAVAGGGAVFWLHSLRYLRYTSDDSYISYRYARNLADGAGLVWNPGEHVEGYTNFLWVVLLAGVHKIGFDIVLSGRWLGFALGILAIGGTYLLCRVLVEGAPGRTAGLVAALLLAASGPFAAWGTAGLETSLFALLLLAAVLAHISEQARRRPPASGILWALLTMTHPAGAIPFAVSGVFKLGESAIRIRQARPGQVAARSEVQRLGVWAAPFALLYFPYFAWRYATYGWLFPNTYYAKVGSGLHQYARGLLYADTFIEEYAIWILLAAPVAILAGSLPRGRAAYVLAVVLAMFAYIVYVGGDGLLLYRFFAPVLPLIYALAVASAASIARYWNQRADAPAWAPTAVCASMAAAFILFTLHASAGIPAVAQERASVNEREEIGRWLRANLPPATVIAVVPAGSIPYESRLPAIDMLGLNDEHIAHVSIDEPSVLIGHEKYDSNYVLDRKPDVIILNDHLTGAAWGLSDYDALRSQIIKAIPDMLSSPRLLSEYEPRSAEVASKWFNMFVRRDSASVLSRTSATPGAHE